jgi:hypothetical protein
MIVRSCRLLLWGCSSRFVLAKMLLEHIAVEESKRLLADDKEQAQHLVSLETAAGQNLESNRLITEASFLNSQHIPSASSIFDQFEDKNGNMSSLDRFNEDRHGNVDRGRNENQMQDTIGLKRSHSQDGDRTCIRSDSNANTSANMSVNTGANESVITGADINTNSTAGIKKKKKLGGSVAKGRSNSRPYTHVGEVSSIVNQCSSPNLSAFQNGNNGLPSFSLGHQQLNTNHENNVNFSQVPPARSSSAPLGGDRFAPHYVSQQPPLHSGYLQQNLQQPSLASYPFGFAPRTQYEQQMMAMNGGMNMVPGVNPSYHSAAHAGPLGSSLSRGGIDTYPQPHSPHFLNPPTNRNQGFHATQGLYSAPNLNLNLSPNLSPHVSPNLSSLNGVHQGSVQGPLQGLTEASAFDPPSNASESYEQYQQWLHQHQFLNQQQKQQQQQQQLQHQQIQHQQR